MSDQGDAYGAFIESELEAERSRRTAFDSRGQTLVSNGGTVVTLLVGLVTLSKNLGANASLPRNAAWVLVGGLAALSVAVACGLAAGWNYLYDAARPMTLRRMIDDHWTDDEVDARNHVATARILTLSTLRQGNNRKARWIAGGQVAMLVGVAALCGVVALTVGAG